jgi:predicted short-subunit dehydrogenase-like oxidoreductase (DUF2520 family)
MSSEMKPSVVFIGAGNLAANLSVALFNSGCQILQVFSRSDESATQLSSKVASAYTTDLADINQNADLYIIAVPDKEIQSAADSLIINKGIVVHSSGSTNIQVLSKFNSNGYGVFYPFQSFSKNRIIPFNDIPICITADSDKTSDFLSRIASMLSHKVILMNPETLPWLHLAGVITNNFTNHLLAVTYQISQEKGIDFELFKPLIEETVKKAFDITPIESQTGPAVRFDQNTINLHIEKLKDYSPPLADIYKALTLSIQNLSRKK